MTTTPSPARSQPQATSSSLLRRPRFWSFFRLLAGLAGAVLVIFPVASGNSYVFSVIGLVLFVAAILFLPTRARATLGSKARELGANLVVEGGRYQLPNSSHSVPVQLFFLADRISALDSRFRTLLEIPIAEISSFLA